MQIEASNEQEAMELAERLTQNGTYAVVNDNCYDSNITVDQAEEIIESNEIDSEVVTDNKNYLSDLED